MKQFLIAISFIFHLSTLANQPDIVFHHISKMERMIYNIVNCFLKGSREMLWIGTYNGLNKYDGTHFYVCKSGTGKNTLPCNIVHGLAKNNEGNIWGSANNEVFCWNVNTRHTKKICSIEKKSWLMYSISFAIKMGFFHGDNSLALYRMNTMAFIFLRIKR